MGRRPKRQAEELECCILWSPLPPITWLIPFIGHMGISDSKGVACDFQGHYNVCEDGYMMVGDPTRYLKMPLNSLTVPPTVDENHDEEEKQRQWDKGLRQANEIYKKRLHNICYDNCHSHVACALNAMGLETFGVKKWDMVKLCFLVFFKARFTSVGSMVQQFGPFLFLMLLCILFSRLIVS